MKNLMTMIILTSLFVSCLGGDSGGNGSGAPGFNHVQLADKFVTELNLDQEFSVELVKSSTQKTDYIVIYDPFTDSFDAINIKNYDPSLDSATEYYNLNSASFYFDLDEIPGHWETTEVSGWYTDWEGDEVYGTWEEDYYVDTQYRDRRLNVYFEKVSASSKDLAKISAIKEAAQIEKSAQFLSSSFGLSLQRSKEISRLTSHWKKASKKAMTDAEIDSFSTELLGFSMTKGLKVAKESTEGNSAGLNQLIKTAADKNNISPEHATRLMTKLFGL